MPSCMSGDWKASWPLTFTANTTLPRPPEVCSLLSTPAMALNILPGPGNRTTTLLTAWQYRPRAYSFCTICIGRPPRVFFSTGS